MTILLFHGVIRADWDVFSGYKDQLFNQPNNNNNFIFKF